MKKILSTILASALVLGVTSCGDDSGEDPIALTITAPSAVSLAAGFEQTISVDAAGSGLASASIQITQGSTTVVTDEMTLSGDEADLDFSFTINATGDYDVALTVTDGAGSSQTANLVLTIACKPSPAFVDDTKVSLVAEAPDFTTGNMGLVGDLTQWADGADIVMTKIGASDCYCALLEPADIASGGFKFRLDGTWDKVEKDSGCGEIDNRTASSAVASDTVSVAIAEWRNSDQFGGGCGN